MGYDLQQPFADPQVLGAPRPIFMHPHYHDSSPNLMNQQYIPAVEMIMAPLSHLSTNSNITFSTAIKEDCCNVYQTGYEKEQREKKRRVRMKHGELWR